MIEEAQIECLADVFKIDRFTVFREYLQLIFLNCLYAEKSADRIFFKGGTAIHLIFNSPRFSEDLDFSTTLSFLSVKSLIKKVEKNVRLEVPGAKIAVWHQGIKSIRFKLKCQAPNFKFPFAIKLDYSQEEVLSPASMSAIVTKFPIMFFPVVAHLSEEEILAEKIRAVLTRAKGRDFFDLWFMLKKGIKLNEKLVNQKMIKVGKKYTNQELMKKIKTFSAAVLESDLRQFLPPEQKRGLPMLKGQLVELLKKREEANDMKKVVKWN